VSTKSEVVDSIRRSGHGNAPAPVTERHSGVRIGLALSGGFVRGIAHIGVLKVLEEANIPISFVAGSSVGALIGAIYCSGMPAGEMEELALCVRRRSFVQLAISRYGFLSSRRMTTFLNRILKARTFEELPLPLAVTATEITTGDGVVIRSGPLAEAVRASCAYPGIFPPVETAGSCLLDGGLTHPVPTQPLRDMGANRILAIHLKSRTGLGGPRNIFDIIAKSMAIVQQHGGTPWRSSADLIVEPEVRQFRFNDFERTSDMIQAGETAMRAALPALIQWFERPPEPAGSHPRDYAPGPAMSY
jgi:NTE family protein